jgi:DNA-binding CsgD family transcriptional regulator
MSSRIDDYRMLLRVIEDLHSARTSEDLRQAAREGLAALVPGDCYDLVFFGSNQAENNAFFAEPGTYTGEEMRFMLEHVHMHPLANAFLETDPGTICISQFVSDRQWQSSMFYRESGYQRLGLQHELAALLPDVTQTSFAAVSVLRSHDFSDRDRRVMNYLRPHLGRAWKRALEVASDFRPSDVRRIFPALSDREAEVLFWITEGKQNREIADILQRSLTTVQEHVENLLRKLNMENRHAMTTFALRALLKTS